MNNKMIVHVINNKTNEETIYYNVASIKVINWTLYIVTSNGSRYQIPIDNNFFAIYNN